ETVLHRVVDVLEKLAVDVPIDRADPAIRVDLKNGHATLRLQVLADQRQRRAARGVERLQRVAAAHAQRTSEQRAHGRALERAALPGEIDLEPAGRSQTRDATVGPRAGQRR